MSSNKPNDGGSQIDGGAEIAGGFIIAGSDSSELFDFTEEIFDQMTGFVAFFIMDALAFAVSLGGNDRRFSSVVQRRDHARVSIVALVGQPCIGLKTWQQAVRAFQIAGWPRREMKPDGVAQGIHESVNFGAQPPFTPADGLGQHRLFLAPALC